MKIKAQEKGHGRIERRIYRFFDVLELEKNARRTLCQIKTAIKVRRERFEIKTNKTSVEESVYGTNEVGRYEELAEAVRGHWSVETNNQIREVSLQENKMAVRKFYSTKAKAGWKFGANCAASRHENGNFNLAPAFR